MGITGATVIAATVLDPSVYRPDPILRPGSGWCCDRIRPVASRSSGKPSCTAVLSRKRHERMGRTESHPFRSSGKNSANEGCSPIVLSIT